MKFSLITPTHSVNNREFLLELYDSILEQTYDNWEWILYLNNGVNLEHIPTNIVENDKVSIHVMREKNTNVGYVKNKAFHLATGDILVELDHDDLLMPDCLEELYKAFQDEEIGFVYSNSIKYDMTNDFVPYNECIGWTYQTVDFKGSQRYVMDAFAPTSHSLCYIWYAPDHVRAWRASVYKDVGGHNPNLPICDDHELCIRTYLSCKMKHIPKPLYVYRITGDNTWLERCSAIQETTVDLFNSYVRALAEKDADKRDLLKIDLGGGLFPYGDYKTVDIRENADITADLNNGIPLPDNSVGVINAHHILEHLDDQQNIMKEIHRVLVHGGWAFIEVPSTDGRGAFQDPTHVTYWNQNSFLYWTDKTYAQFIDNDDVRFQIFKLNDYYPSEYMKEKNIVITCAVLVAIKHEHPRFPGELNI